MKLALPGISRLRTSSPDQPGRAKDQDNPADRVTRHVCKSPHAAFAEHNADQVFLVPCTQSISARDTELVSMTRT